MPKTLHPLQEFADAEGDGCTVDAYSRKAWDRITALRARSYDIQPPALEGHVESLMEWLEEFINEPWSATEWIKVTDRPNVDLTLTFLEGIVKSDKRRA